MRQTLAAIRHLEDAVTGADWTDGIVLRYGGFYGPGTSLALDGGEHLELIRRRRFPVVGSGAGVWSFVHIDDVASATLAAIEHGTPGVYHVVDDDPARVSAFLAEHPGAAWVQTAEECLARLEEPWDEVHLDHDLGGETLVDHERDDCGMEVVRWLCLQPRPHLQAARFFVHTHNPNAACIMALRLQVAGFHVDVRPFRPGVIGRDLVVASLPDPRPLIGRVIGWMRRLGER
jgi:hypothetical protein